MPILLINSIEHAMQECESMLKDLYNKHFFDNSDNKVLGFSELMLSNWEDKVNLIKLKKDHYSKKRTLEHSLELLNAIREAFKYLQKKSFLSFDDSSQAYSKNAFLIKNRCGFFNGLAITYRNEGMKKMLERLELIKTLLGELQENIQQDNSKGLWKKMKSLFGN